MANVKTAVAKYMEDLGKRYGFNGSDHVEGLLKVIGMEPETDTKSVSSAGDDLLAKIAVCKKNVALWQKKLDDGKVKDADKQREKIAKEIKKWAKLEEKAGIKHPKEEPVANAGAGKPEEKPEEPPKEEKKEKRIKRFSPVMASQLKKALEDKGLEMSDKLKKEFQQYIEALSDAAYRKEGLADHMRAFASLKVPAKVEEEGEADKPVPPKTVEVTLKELQDISVAAAIDTPGTFWDADNGRFVKGPDADDDEDFTETKFDGKDYVVGDKTGRVYEARETGDVFAGFIGVGKFKAMKV